MVTLQEHWNGQMVGIGLIGKENKMTPEILHNYIKELGLKLCHLERRTLNHQEAEKVKQALKDFQPQEGWLCFQSTVTHFKNGKLPDEGIILYGEVKAADNKALHIQQDGNGSWRVTTYQQQAGKSHLVESTQLLGEFEEIGNLRYRVYWANDGEQGYRQICAAFNGFI